MKFVLFPAAHAKVLNAICSKICIQDYPVDTICAAHKRKRETELKHRDQTVTYQSFFSGPVSVQLKGASMHSTPFDAMI